jgi:hypothetical protein
MLYPFPFSLSQVTVPMPVGLNVYWFVLIARYSLTSLALTLPPSGDSFPLKQTPPFPSFSQVTVPMPVGAQRVLVHADRLL